MKLKSLDYNWKLIADQSTSALIHVDIRVDALILIHFQEQPVISRSH